MMLMEPAPIPAAAAQFIPGVAQGKFARTLRGSMATLPILEVSGLQVARGTTTILRGVNWRVQRGEHWAILGSNGSGKTSLLKSINGYLSPTDGAISLLGRRYGETDWRELRLEIGLVTSALQASIPGAEPALETVVSGKFAQLDLWANPSRADWAQARRWLRFVGGTALAKREWIFLSQGERQRVLIARALMARPRLLILDEPCAGLDPVAREEFLRFVEALARKRGGPALILVTHHVEEIMPAFTHALLLRAGAVFAAGPKLRAVTSRTLSATFGAPVRVRFKAGRFQATVRAAPIRAGRAAKRFR
jgi:iron complex transport system ATP-binding protein